MWSLQALNFISAAEKMIFRVLIVDRCTKFHRFYQILSTAYIFCTVLETWSKTINWLWYLTNFQSMHANVFDLILNGYMSYFSVSTYTVIYRRAQHWFFFLSLVILAHNGILLQSLDTDELFFFFSIHCLVVVFFMSVTFI